MQHTLIARVTYSYLIVHLTIPQIQTDRSVTANANIYALVDVVILHKYTDINSKFPGNPTRHVKKME